jgi:hypothetical protein
VAKQNVANVWHDNRGRAQIIVHRQEELAIRLLDRALNKYTNAEQPPDQPEIDVQLDVFEKVGKWVSIKNKLEELGESQIEQYKRRIAAEGALNQKRTHKLESTGALARLKNRLPDRSVGGDDGDRDDIEREDLAVT